MTKLLWALLYSSFCEHTFLFLVGAELLSYRVTVWLMLKKVTKLYPQVAVCSHMERTRVPIFPQPCQLLVLLVFFILAVLVRCAVVSHWSTHMPTSLTSSRTAAPTPTFFPSLPDRLSVSPMFWAFFLEFSSSQTFRNSFLFMVQFSAQLSPPQRPPHHPRYWCPQHFWSYYCFFFLCSSESYVKESYLFVYLLIVCPIITSVPGPNTLCVFCLSRA